jgi:collagen type I/II/III/V/XI/XXIV/XXVII alpha
LPRTGPTPAAAGNFGEGSGTIDGNSVVSVANGLTVGNAAQGSLLLASGVLSTTGTVDGLGNSAGVSGTVSVDDGGLLSITGLLAFAGNSGAVATGLVSGGTVVAGGGLALGAGGLASVLVTDGGTLSSTGTFDEIGAAAGGREHLRIGDRVLLATGGVAPVIWLGHRHLRPHDVHPVRIRRDAFGVGRPGRDLYLSPDHAVFVDGALIPIRYLVNGATIERQEFSHVTYWHIELPAHGVVLAEGLPAESYLDTGNRAAFVESKAGLCPEPRQEPSPWTLINGFPKASGLWWVQGKALALPSTAYRATD